MRQPQFHRNIVTRLFAALILTVALAPGVLAQQAVSRFQIAGAPGAPVHELDIITLDSGGFLDLADIDRALGGQLEWAVPGASIRWSVQAVECEFTDMVVFFVAGGSSYQLVAAPRLEGGRFLVPLQVATEYLPRLLPDRFVYDRTSGRLIDSGARPAPREPVAAGQAESFRIRTVVIDPGHGGKDPGTPRRRLKMDEKQIVLDISRKVAGRLKERSGLQVILTRDSDEFIPLGDRGKKANEAGANLFISIHVNASDNRSLDGSSTYFLSAAKTDEERATAMLENAALQYEDEQQDEYGRDEINLILQDMAQNEHLRESKDLSSFIQGELARLSGLRDRGLRQANLAVLRGSYMPAALVETAYISNPGDEKNLNSAAFRDRIADAIANGIIKYVEQYHRKLANGS